jgi:xylose dehydrogenase (NAD/NADP)
MAAHTALRWGLLSTARINRALIPPLRSSEYSQLMAVASRDATRADEFAATWNIPRSYSNYDELLADRDIDIVYISLPNSLHAEWSIKSMRMGKHVLCEKPLTTSIRELDVVANVSRETGKIIAEAYMYRHHPQTLLIKNMISNGEIGNLQLIRGMFRYHNIRPSDPRFDPQLGGGSLWDIGGYPIGYACYLTGEPPIEVFGRQVTGPTSIDLLYAGQLHFPGGVICQFDCSFISEFKVEMEISGDQGRITIPEPFKPGKRCKILLQKSGVEKTIIVKGKELYAGEIEDLENAVLHGTSPLISMAQSRDIIGCIEALYVSSHDLKTIHLEEIKNVSEEP